MKKSTFRLLVPAIITLAFPLYAHAVANPWVDAHAYVVGDFVRINNENPANSTYRCKTAHTSTPSNAPPVLTVWEHVWPSEPPKTAPNGAGPTGDDIADFGDNNFTMVGLKTPHSSPPITGDFVIATAYGVHINTANPNHIQANNRTTAGARVSHILFQLDYDGAGMPTQTQGQVYWNWYYDGYTPAITLVGEATNVRNCVSAAYHGYKSGSTVSTNWTDNTSGDDNLFHAELTIISASGNNGAFATQENDRINKVNVHMWIVGPVYCNPDGRAIAWKNNTSRYCSWINKTASFNDCPPGKGNAYGEYEVLRK